MEQNPAVVFCERSNKPLVPIKALAQLKYYQLLCSTRLISLVCSVNVKFQLQYITVSTQSAVSPRAKVKENIHSTLKQDNVSSNRISVSSTPTSP
jgi:hypothetical protein